jgi:hypothetical protein
LTAGLAHYPLTLSEVDKGITATRNIAYDFSLQNEDSIRVWGANVEDSYTVSNSSFVFYGGEYK